MHHVGVNGLYPVTHGKFGNDFVFWLLKKVLDFVSLWLRQFWDIFVRRAEEQEQAFMKSIVLEMVRRDFLLSFDLAIDGEFDGTLSLKKLIRSNSNKIEFT